jgi:hypothetical protein
MVGFFYFFLMKNRTIIALSFLFAGLVSCGEKEDQTETTALEKSTVQTSEEVLGSWEQAPKDRIVSWVDAVTQENSSSFIPPAERIAVFDNDGTLWSEQPFYFQLFFVIDPY